MRLVDWNNKHLDELINILPVEPKNVRKKLLSLHGLHGLHSLHGLQSAWSAFWGDRTGRGRRLTFSKHYFLSAFAVRSGKSNKHYNLIGIS